MGSVFGAVPVCQNTRTTELFINTDDNSHLNGKGYAPFGFVVRGFNTILHLHNPTPKDSNGVNEASYKLLGNKWIKETYPSINFIVKASVKDDKC